jgi:hypothetical protein
MSDTHSDRQPVDKSISVPQMLVRITGLLQIVLGLVFWSGNAKGLVPIHMVSGIILVLSLWALAVAGARAGVGNGLVATAAVWGLIVPGLGFSQKSMMHGGAHWVIQVIHLVVGLIAIMLAEQLATKAIAAAGTSGTTGASGTTTTA